MKGSWRVESRAGAARRGAQSGRRWAGGVASVAGEDAGRRRVIKIKRHYSRKATADVPEGGSLLEVCRGSPVTSADPPTY